MKEAKGKVPQIRTQLGSSSYGPRQSSNAIGRPVALRALLKFKWPSARPLESRRNLSKYTQIPQARCAKSPEITSRLRVELLGVQGPVVATPVHFDVVDAPAREEICILLVVPERPGRPTVVAGLHADGGVPAPGNIDGTKIRPAIRRKMQPKISRFCVLVSFLLCMHSPEQAQSKLQAQAVHVIGHRLHPDYVTKLTKNSRKTHEAARKNS